jgi:hypothetical protein
MKKIPAEKAKKSKVGILSTAYGGILITESCEPIE